MNTKEVTLTLTHDELAELCKLIAIASHPFHCFVEYKDELEDKDEPIFNMEVNEAVQHKIQALAEEHIPNYFDHTIPEDFPVKPALWGHFECLGDYIMNCYGEKTIDLSLGSVLAKRDFHESYGVKATDFEYTSPMWRNYTQLLNWYWREFENHGLSHVRVVENASLGIN
jgi:hypothetical protein